MNTPAKGTPTSEARGETATRSRPSGRPERVLAAMSGGVDSSVAAAMLVEAGHEVVGATMKTFCYSGTGGNSKTCCGLDGIRDARQVADVLGIPHYVFDVEEAFTRDVIDDFVNEYGRGRTPNPCVRCNSNTKFRDLLARARALGCDAVASGHYARLDLGGVRPRLLRGADESKDQTYFLWALPADLLGRLRFPLGALTKAEVRARARSMGLATADKPESQEICFVPEGRYRDFLGTRLLPTHPALSPGPLVDPAGKRVGTHNGYADFTVGQRKGLGGGMPERFYVLEIRPRTREVVIGPKRFLHARTVFVDDLNWLAPPPRAGDRLHVQLRHRGEALPCRVVACNADELELSLDEPARPAAPGQSAVLFAGAEVLGGGRSCGRVDGGARYAPKTALAGCRPGGSDGTADEPPHALASGGTGLGR